MTAKFLRGFIDGSLSTLGVVIGASSGAELLIVAAAVGGTLANGFSNALSAYSASQTEERAALRSVEQAMVTSSLGGSLLEARAARRSLLAGLIDAGGTIAGGMVPVWPFLAWEAGPGVLAAVASVGVSTAGVGAFMGRLGRRSMAWSALKMVVIAAAMSAAVWGVQRLIVPG